MIDIFLLHGISKEVKAETYYNAFIEGIEKYLSGSQQVRWHPIDYSFLLREKEETILSWMKELGHPKSRKFACDYISDILAMLHKDRPLVEGDFLYDFDKLVTTRYDTIHNFYPENRKVIIGHSLGSILGYRFTWKRAFDALIVMNSPFNYFSIGYKDFGEMNPNLPMFYNFWKKYDTVSTIISKNPNFKMVKDIQVKSLNPLNWFTSKAHSACWTDKFVHKTISNILTELEKP